MSESGIFDDVPERENSIEPSVSYSLLGVSALARFYRISRDGKYFFFKAFNPDNPLSEKYIRREFEISRGSHHPNIVDIYMLEEIEGIGYGLLMEYIEGRNLTRFLAEKPSFRAKRRIFSQLLEALAYLHKKGIVHNDLKPENILISYNGDFLKLIDFGLSDDEAHFLVKTPGCTPTFAAPELKENQKSDIRSDVYSLGLLMQKIFGKNYLLISRRCLRKESRKRYTDASSLQKAWKRNKLFRSAVPWFLSACVVAAVFILSFNNVRSVSKDSDNPVVPAAPEIIAQTPSINEDTGMDVSLNPIVEKTVSSGNIKPGMPDQEENKTISLFKNSMSRLRITAIDSLKKSGNPKEMLLIFNNYHLQAREVYRKQIEDAGNKVLETELTSELYKEMEEFEMEFNKLMEEAVERIKSLESVSQEEQ